jgi:hypothetical protein
MAAVDDGYWALIAEIVVDKYLAARAAHAVAIKPVTREVYERGDLERHRRDHSCCLECAIFPRPAWASAG